MKLKGRYRVHRDFIIPLVVGSRTVIVCKRHPEVDNGKARTETNFRVTEPGIVTECDRLIAPLEDKGWLVRLVFRAIGPTSRNYLMLYTTPGYEELAKSAGDEVVDTKWLKSRC